ncbi:MAG: phosphate/phosphite/phosphonate ABC transporter substrate-binding protein [Rhodobacteraceae bacterium]|nr:MAG: phosphate/phosphite/phosphonate ABC transporter substrate-binding protein [Paracoccaceae bacterium]
MEPPMQHRRSAIAGLAFAALLGPVAFASQLDARFVDEDGDLLADPPADRAQMVDPSTLIFTYAPVEDPAQYAEIWEEFIAHLSNVTGREVRYFSVNSYAAMVEAMRAGRLHVGGFATGSVPLGVNCAGLHPMVTMSLDGRIRGYEMEIITHIDSDIMSMDDIKGRQMAFVNPASNSGFRAPSALLSSEFGIDVETDLQTAFSGGHDASILGVANRDYDTAAIANSVVGRMAARGVVNLDDFRVLYRSETFPTTAYGAVYNLVPELKEAIREAFLTFEWGGALAEEFGDADGFIEIDYKEHWDIIRRIAAAAGDELSCR